MVDLRISPGFGTRSSQSLGVFDLHRVVDFESSSPSERVYAFGWHSIGRNDVSLGVKLETRCGGYYWTTFTRIDVDQECNSLWRLDAAAERIRYRRRAHAQRVVAGVGDHVDIDPQVLAQRRVGRCREVDVEARRAVLDRRVDGGDAAAEKLSVDADLDRQAGLEARRVGVGQRGLDAERAEVGNPGDDVAAAKKFLLSTDCSLS